MQQRETATNRLADVIQVIQLGRKTGILSAEQGQGRTFEEGTITFANGQITQASVGLRQGQEALSVLKTWRGCLFAFIPPSTSNITPFQFPTPHSQQSDQDTGKPNAVASKDAVPYRTKPIEEVLPVLDLMNFSRSHRRLLLLIDGERNISELIRLLGRNAEEVFRQLGELERAGFIHQ